MVTRALHIETHITLLRAYEKIVRATWHVQRTRNADGYGYGRKHSWGAVDSNRAINVLFDVLARIDEQRFEEEDALKLDALAGMAYGESAHGDD